MAHAKTTSKSVATKASSLLKSKATSPKTKSVAGSALAQKHKSSGRVARQGATISARPPRRGGR